ncbi:hypothetical protein [Aliikangiella coralliicola]|uniref:Uncharacterized protein n=1 Tax=Aliikangiella coralliicola TaxID=2592383 RepID=A0A545TZY6_9GAMM|nr:hypothetical protein [Aliikangiella coralliicola]TQV82780.1 hypothetical protein FLL46_23705 [Aliikangiella coralliicola]
MLNRTFHIQDIVGRNWGTFTVEKETVDFLGEKQVHGYLKPAPAFKEVRNLFLTHEIEMSQAGNSIDSNWQEIVALKPYLVDIKSNKNFDIGGVIFIGENFLVTCKIKDLT